MWKYLIALLIPVLAFAVGYYYAPGKTVEVEKIVTKTDTVVKDHIVTRTVEIHSDGTRTEVTKEEDKSKEETVNQKQTDTETKPISGSGENYRIGAKYWVGSTSDLQKPGYDHLGVSLGRRIIGPVWLDVEGNKREVAAGISVTW